MSQQGGVVILRAASLEKVSGIEGRDDSNALRSWSRTVLHAFTAATGPERFEFVLWVVKSPRVQILAKSHRRLYSNTSSCRENSALPCPKEEA